MADKRVFYMHTIAGKPAEFDGTQVSYARQNSSCTAQLVPDMKTLRRQQKASAEWRRKHGFPHLGDYGYLRVMEP